MEPIDEVTELKSRIDELDAKLDLIIKKFERKVLPQKGYYSVADLSRKTNFDEYLIDMTIAKFELLPIQAKKAISDDEFITYDTYKLKDLKRCLKEIVANSEALPVQLVRCEKFFGDHIFRINKNRKDMK